METQESRWQPAVFLGPAVFLLFVLMVYPSLETIRLSFLDKDGVNFVGFANYEYSLTSRLMREAIGNNLRWLVFFTLGTVVFGLIIATLVDRVRYETFAKAIIFLPMAISFVGAGVIWKFVYDLNPPGAPLQPGQQIGVLNAMLMPLRPDGDLNDVVNSLQNEGVAISRDDVIAAIVNTELPALQSAVDEGELTQARASELESRLFETAGKYMDGTLPPENEEWQALGQWGRTAIDRINAALAALPAGSGRAICNAVPFACVYEIEDVEEDALEAAVDAGTLEQARADQIEDDLEAAAHAYVTSGARPAGEGWQTVDQWDSVIAGISAINVRSVNSTLDTGIEPVDWIREPSINNFALILVGVWIWTGFCMVVLSAALKNIPGELFEAARVDGANELQIFFRITIPALMPTLTVVTTTMIVNVLKVFDIVYVMTAGNFGTEVIANRMYLEMYGGNREFGHASAIAVVLMIAIVPVMIFNIRQFRRQEAQR